MSTTDRERRRLGGLHTFVVMGTLLLGCAGPHEAPPSTTTSTTTTTTSTTTTTTSTTTTAAATDLTEEGLRWTIGAYPESLTMRDRATFRLRRTVKNESNAVRDAMRGSATFTINGEPSRMLDMAFGNGARESRWGALPPSESVFDERLIGESLFQAPGRYHITMTVRDATSSVDVIVSP